MRRLPSLSKKSGLLARSYFRRVLLLGLLGRFSLYWLFLFIILFGCLGRSFRFGCVGLNFLLSSIGRSVPRFGIGFPCRVQRNSACTHHYPQTMGIPSQFFELCHGGIASGIRKLLCYTLRWNSILGSNNLAARLNTVVPLPSARCALGLLFLCHFRGCCFFLVFL